MQHTHSDERRNLYSFPEAKLIEAKRDCTLGQHYHKIKTERFILCSGACEIIRDSRTEPMQIGRVYTVEPGVIHAFNLKKDSILIGLNSRPFDPTDDYYG